MNFPAFVFLNLNVLCGTRCAGFAVHADSSNSSNLSAAIEEVVVTAEFRSVAVTEVPGSVSLLVPQDRADVANHLEELLGAAVNVN